MFKDSQTLAFVNYLTDECVRFTHPPAQDSCHNDEIHAPALIWTAPGLVSDGNLITPMLVPNTRIHDPAWKAWQWHAKPETLNIIIDAGLKCHYNRSLCRPFSVKEETANKI